MTYWYIFDKKTGRAYRLEGKVPHFPYLKQAERYIEKRLGDYRFLRYTIKKRTR